ncbi:MAG: hypothetical protein IT159_09855 [Bryobacterales bacterium]|nr:hypothetical protein [Bryobacterales bacterium]
MLFVFLLAGFAAIALYMELPRVVFEAQRNREQTLVDHGEQYRRAIQLYYRQFRVYPPNLDALESTNNRRFLRRRYKDPMTGEDEWRLIHGLPNGIFTDSLIHKPPGQQDKKDAETETAEAAAPLWMQRRPSDTTLPPDPGLPATDVPSPEAGFDPSFAGAAPPPQETPQSAAGQFPLIPGQPSIVPGGPVMPGTTITVGGLAGQPAPLPGPQGAIVPPGFLLGASPPGVFGQPPAQQPAAGSPMVPGVPGQPPAGSNPAIDMIRNLLTTPNPRGLAAIQVSGSQQSGGPAGIAGVASKLEAEGIMVYNERTKYNEWEFLYDPRLDLAAQLPVQGTGPQFQGPGQTSGTGPAFFPGGFGDGPQQRGPGGPGLRDSGGRRGGGGGFGPGGGFGQGGGGFGPGGGGFGQGGRGGGGFTPFPVPGGFGAPQQPQTPRR